MTTLNFFGGILGGTDHAKKDEISKFARRDSLSKYLPYHSYDPEEHYYMNNDDTYGYLWECTPLAFASMQDMSTLKAMFRIDFPKKTVLQVMLYADPNITSFVEKFKQGKNSEGDLTARNIDEYSSFLLEGVNGVDALYGIPFRNFRCFVALKSVEEINKDDLSVIEEALLGAGLAPRNANASVLVDLMRRLLNRHIPESIKEYDETLPINKQLIYAETEIAERNGCIEIGNDEDGRVYARCLTPKTVPKETTTLDTNELTGGIMGLSDDTNQITAPFLWSANIIFDDGIKSEIHNKANITMMQKASGSFAQQIQKRSEEFTWALNEIDNEKFVKVMPSLWVFGKSPEETRAATARARRIWENKNYVMQEEGIIRKAMFLTSMPFGLYPSNEILKTLDRDFYMTAKAAVRMLPIQADFVGTPDNPVLCYIGRKGQVAGLDVFDPRSNNHNFLVTAGSGAGKSFSLNYLLSNYFATGSKVRVVDLGYSYQKLCRTVGGKFLDFGREVLTINPFDSNARDDEDRKFDDIATANIIAEMVYSASRHDLEETEWTLLKDAVRWARSQNPINGIDLVCTYLSEFPNHAEDELKEFHFAKEVAMKMSFNLHDFKSDGAYGEYFNGESTFNIKDDDFVVLELERLKPQKELFRVITLLVLNAITQDLYLSDRSSRRFILFEEAWSFFDSGNRIGPLIEEGYRRARKYSGAFGIVTQSLLDLLKFGDSGDVIRSNAEYKFLMQSSDYLKSAEEKVLEFEGLALDLVCSVKNKKPRYSEMFLDTPFGKGPVRLVVDPWTYWVNTSAGGEVQQFNKLHDEGMPVVEILETLSGIKK